MASGTLLTAAQELSAARDLPTVQHVVKHAARRITGADGTTFVLRDGDLCHYVDEDAIGPLWKGRRFPMTSCISGWAMLHRRPAIIPDIYADERIPLDAYRPTFVKSLTMVPIGAQEPVGAIGSYWAVPHHASDDEIRSIQALANFAALAIEKITLVRDLERSIRVRDEFLLLAGHELRTPLAALILRLEGMRAADGAATDAARLLQEAERAREMTGRLETLIETLLEAAHLELGIVKLAPKAGDACEIVRTLAARRAAAARRAGCELKLDLPESCAATFDAQRLERAFDKLLDNAIKYGPGKPVEVRLTRRPNAVEISVVDHGPGLDNEALARVFGRFERGVPLAHYGGFGIGLFVAKRWVEAHGGTIRVQSSPGQGSTFTIVLPADA